MNKLNYFILFLLFVIGTSPRANAVTGFGEQNTDSPEPVNTSPAPIQISDQDQNSNTAASSSLVPAIETNTLPPSGGSTSMLQEPPAIQGVEWLKVPYDKAENEVLALFQRDIPKLEDLAHEVVIYEVKTSGAFPPSYQRSIRYKLERVFLTSKRIQVKQCVTCEEARLTKTESGEIRFESYSSDLTRAKRIGTEVGVDHFIYSDMIYTPEDLVLRVRMTRASTGQLLWSKEYSSADVVRTREGASDSTPEELGSRDALSRVIIGEIAFTPSLSFGVMTLPSIDMGSGSELVTAPAVELFMGEKFDRGRKIFGFFIGGMYNRKSASTGTALEWALRFGPRFTYVFNPYNVSTARYALNVEAGGIMSEGIGTPYFGLGPEIKMINRFSAALMPIFILPSGASGEDSVVQNPDGTFSSSAGKSGRFGGFGAIMKVSMTW